MQKEEINYNMSAVNKPEYIICAAIWYKDGIKYDNQPSGITDGYVVCGRRHHNCIFMNWTLTGRRNCEHDGYIQGFLTSKDKFVDRYEGAKIAHGVGQTEDPKGPLFSEDLY